MISLRKHIENLCDPMSCERMVGCLTAYRSTLAAIGEQCQRAMEIPGRDLAQTFEGIQQSLEGQVTRAQLESAAVRAAAELSDWADSVGRRRAENERELKEMVGVLARTAESVAERDEKYSRQIGQVNGSLHSIMSCNDMAAVRKSILETARALDACVTDMVEESRQSVERLTQEITEYRARLAESERISLIDALTGLANRREIERSLDARMKRRETFCLAMVDLNGFKAVNDRWGHVAGDDLLRQFSCELKAQFGGGDLVGRWGGDEFVMLVGGGGTVAESRIERVRDWVLGDYQVAAGDGSFKVTLDAALGLVEWDGRETGPELLARADRQVYEGKERGISSRDPRHHEARKSSARVEPSAAVKLPAVRAFPGRHAPHGGS